MAKKKCDEDIERLKMRSGLVGEIANSVEIIHVDNLPSSYAYHDYRKIIEKKQKINN